MGGSASIFEYETSIGGVNVDEMAIFPLFEVKAPQRRDCRSFYPFFPQLAREIVVIEISH